MTMSSGVAPLALERLQQVLSYIPTDEAWLAAGTAACLTTSRCESRAASCVSSRRPHAVRRPGRERRRGALALGLALVGVMAVYIYTLVLHGVAVHGTARPPRTPPSASEHARAHCQTSPLRTPRRRRALR
eukprot:scaffold443_cov527-Prasinococcus_capsulatus_cf.AAC.27